MKNIGIGLACIFSGIVGGLVVWALVSFTKVSVFDPAFATPSEVDISYADFVMIMLGVVTVVLACLTVAVGLVAGMTFTNITAMSEAKFDKMMNEKARAVEKQIGAIAFGAGAYLNKSGGEEADDEEEDR
ncbi:hypothetical protein [Tateyamaria sp.]|uniref:hypothetical protein n=1 Tax=Tateyamaria sp. TaxID=1929288 RepID=UPI00329B9B9E